MSQNLLKEKLHSYVDEGDDKLLKLMYAIAFEYNHVDDQAEFTEDELAQFEQRHESRMNGTSNLYSWNETKQIILNKKSF